MFSNVGIMLTSHDSNNLKKQKNAERRGKIE